MPDYVYLDSNAFWLLKPTDKDFDQEFRETIERIRGRYRFPFSEAHFLDIATGDKLGNQAQVESNLIFLNTISHGYGVALEEGRRRPPDEFGPVLGPIPNSDLPWIVQGYFTDVIGEYRKLPKDQIQEPQIYFEGSEHIVNLNKIPKDHPLLPLLRAAGGILSPELMQKFGQELWENRDDPAFYRNFRRSVADAFELIGTNGRLMDSEAAKVVFPLKEFVCAKDISEITARLVGATRTLCLVKGDDLDKLRWSDRLIRAYHLLDFHPELWEPTNKKNRPGNIRIDSKHLIYAAGAKHFVTEDKRFAAKAAVVFSAFGIGARVGNLSEFKARFS